MIDAETASLSPETDSYDRFRDFCRTARDLKDVAPHLAVLTTLTATMPTERALWLTLLWSAHDNLASAWTAYTVTVTNYNDVRMVPDRCRDLPVGAERLTLQDWANRRTHLRSILKARKIMGGFERWLTRDWQEHDPVGNFHRLLTTLTTIGQNPPANVWAAAVALVLVGNWSVPSPARYDGSRTAAPKGLGFLWRPGPKRGLSHLASTQAHGQSAHSILALERQTEELRSRLANDGIFLLLSTLGDLLTDYDRFCVGAYTPGDHRLRIGTDCLAAVTAGQNVDAVIHALDTPAPLEVSA